MHIIQWSTYLLYHTLIPLTSKRYHVKSLNLVRRGTEAKAQRYIVVSDNSWIKQVFIHKMQITFTVLVLLH